MLYMITMGFYLHCDHQVPHSVLVISENALDSVENPMRMACTKKIVTRFFRVIGVLKHISNLPK